jgi:hypothetical protein
MTTAVEKLQEQFNVAISKRDAMNSLRHECSERGDAVGEQRYLDAMKELGILAMDAQRQIGDILSKK